METYDIIIIGGGIVGSATAWRLQQRLPDASILLLDKETQCGSHQTGHNSGVIHAGVYYQPGSLKADFCRRGARATFEFCRTYNLPVQQCGKLLVATDDIETERMAALAGRCRENGIEFQMLDARQLAEREPNITGAGALFVPATGITDYRRITIQMAQCFNDCGGQISLGSEVTGLKETGDSVVVTAGRRQLAASYLIVCGGLMADRLVRMMAIKADFRIVPFRGEYYRLPPHLSGIVTHLIYPIPDPELPFLGVHLTRMIDGSVTVGPNAVLGFKREGYGRFNFDVRDTIEMLGYPGFWRVARNNLYSGLAEIKDSLFKKGYLQRVQKYCPQLQWGDLLAYPAGIRAQAVTGNGELVHDFLFARSQRSLHVCNAPSPAATSALPIAEHLCDEALKSFGLRG